MNMGQDHEKADQEAVDTRVGGQARRHARLGLEASPGGRPLRGEAGDWPSG